MLDEWLFGFKYAYAWWQAQSVIKLNDNSSNIYLATFQFNGIKYAQ